MYKCVVLGDQETGKTTMIEILLHNQNSQDYTPTVFNKHRTKFIFNNHEMELEIWDSAVGQKGYQRLRPLIYHGTNIFIICYSLNNETSYTNIIEEWIPDIMQYCPECPFIIVGTKSDLPHTINKDQLSKLNIYPRFYGHYTTSKTDIESIKLVFTKCLEALNQMNMLPSNSKTQSRKCQLI